MTEEDLTKARAIIAQYPWKTATSPQYRDAPHSYIIRGKCGRGWQELAELVWEYGVPRQWRGRTFTYLEVDGDVFWVMGKVLNRALASQPGNWAK